MLHRPVEPSQYVAVRYTQRLAEAGAVASVGSTGDSYDNALAEAFNSLFKAELVRNKGPWKSIDDLEIAVAEYIDWFNHRRLHGQIGLIPPARKRRGHRGGRPRSLDTTAYRRRNVVERHFALTKQWRGLATRYDKLAITYRAAVVLAACITWSRI